MAAYGGLISLMNLMEQVQLYHDRNQIFNDRQQVQLHTLRNKVSFLQQFLEIHSNGVQTDGEVLESSIAHVVYDAEDLVESHIVDIIPAQIKRTRERDSGDHFSQQLCKVIKDMDVIQRKAQEIDEKNKVSNETVQRDLATAGSHRPPIGKDPKMVFENSLMNEVLAMLITGRQSDLQTIAITGMGGIGKTVLARYVYDNPRIKRQFDIRGWITISQEFNIRDILVGLLRDMGVGGNLEGNIEYWQLGEKLHKYLYGRRYLIVIDDFWSLEAWHQVRMFLPNTNTGSRIVITTRVSNLADAISTHHYRMKLLDENESWTLLQRDVFGEVGCPSELQEIGKRIARSCSGLPLTIVTTAGVLVRHIDREYWERVAKDTDAGLVSQDDEHYFQVLNLSYRYLPIHLKPCFLYLGVFQKDHSIRVSQITKLWVAEGFLKPSEGRMLEDVATDYLKDLIDRNLIYVDGNGSTGNVKCCRIHNLLRDLCLREAKRLNFLNVTKVQNPDISQAMNSQRRVVLLSKKSEELYSPELNRALQSSSFVRSFLCNFPYTAKPSFDVKLLRIWSVEKSYRAKVLSELVNSRYLDFGFGGKCHRFPSSMRLLWNLQTITLGLEDTAILPSDIWEMSELRHVNIDAFECGDPCGDNIVLEKLQTLSKILDFRCSKMVLRIIPNLRKLKVCYQDGMLLPEYLQNIGGLTKLESLHCRFGYHFPEKNMSNLEFPFSLKKLSLLVRELNWEDMGEKIGSLPNLEKLKLCASQGGKVWEPIEGQFQSLKFLHIETQGLECWRAEYTHFPSLEHLRLEHLNKLEEIPLEIGEIDTLLTLKLYDCSESANQSARRILEEQQSLWNDSLVVNIY